MARLALLAIFLMSAGELMSACELSDDASMNEGEYNDAPWSYDTWHGSESDTSTPPPPPEEELELQAPQASRDFVFVASTTLDSVAKIHARSLQIESIAVGDEPTIVRTRPSINTAAVLNYGSADVNIIHAQPDGVTTVERVRVERGMNAMVISPTGSHVVVYYDAEAAGPLGVPPTEGQLVHVASLITGEEAIVGLTVTFNVRDVLFDTLGELAYVITDDAIHTIDLTAVVADPSSYDRNAFVSLRDTPIGTAVDREVTLTVDGRYAVVRSNTFAGLVLIDMDSGEQRIIDLDGAPTDLDLMPHGDGVLAIVRDTRQAVIAALPDAFYDPTDIRVVQAPETIPIGQALVTGGGCTAVVFSTAARTNTIGELDLCTAELTPYRMGSGKIITGAALSPTGRWVYVAHEADSQATDPIDREHGFSLLDFGTASGLPADTLFKTDAAPGALAFTGNEEHLYVLVDDRGADIRQTVHVELGSMHQTTDTMGSPPVLIGTLPEIERVYVGQEHPVGRISFIDTASGRVQTVTGFELNSRIR